MWETLFPKVGDLIKIFEMWRNIKNEPEQKFIELLEKISEELRELSNLWISIASTIQSESESGNYRTADITFLSQRSHFEALRSFYSDLIKFSNRDTHDHRLELSKNLVRILKDALGEKGRMYWLVTKFFMPDHPGVEAYSPDIERRNMNPEKIAKDSNINIQDSAIRIKNTLSILRVRRPKKSLEQEAMEAEIKKESLQALAAASERLAGFAGEFRAAVSIYKAQKR
jgi:hypothetical protein